MVRWRVAKVHQSIKDGDVAFGRVLTALRQDRSEAPTTQAGSVTAQVAINRTEQGKHLAPAHSSGVLRRSLQRA